jgi:hypothetical protein
MQLLFEFLSFDEFKFVKIVERNVCSHVDDAPRRGACAAFGGATFLGGCARFVRAYMLCQFNAFQCVLAHVMHNMIL